jgi:hypothetical protein
MKEHGESCMADNLIIFFKRLESVSQTGNAQNVNPEQVHKRRSQRSRV